MSSSPLTDPVMAMLAQSALRTTQLAPTSRYHGIDTATLVLPGGVMVTYLRRSFLPASARFPLQEEYTVRQGDRLDNIAARFFGDPELFWRICDANDAMRPQELTGTLARVLRITLPEGAPGVSL